jgi:hypothetical protein
MSGASIKQQRHLAEPLQRRLARRVEPTIAEALANQRFARGLGVSYKQWQEHQEWQRKVKSQQAAESFKYFFKVIFVIALALLGCAVVLAVALLAIGAWVPSSWTQPMDKLDEIYWLLVVGFIILITRRP